MWDQAGEESMPEEALWLQGTGLEIRTFAERNAVRAKEERLTGAERGKRDSCRFTLSRLAEAAREPGPDEILRQIRLMREHSMLTPRKRQPSNRWHIVSAGFWSRIWAAPPSRGDKRTGVPRGAVYAPVRRGCHSSRAGCCRVRPGRCHLGTGDHRPLV
jgi:hypothetical protein